jgi:hypothetical protein
MPFAFWIEFFGESLIKALRIYRQVRALLRIHLPIAGRADEMRDAASFVP